VLAIAAGIVEGLDLGHNALAALVAQGCAEIRWLAEKLGAKPQTMSGLSGLGDIMLTCYGDLSRNRSVGMRLGRGERLEDIIASSTQVGGGAGRGGAARRGRAVTAGSGAASEDNVSQAVAVRRRSRRPAAARPRPLTRLTPPLCTRGRRSPRASRRRASSSASRAATA
jgi:hypothetical protein